MVRVGRQTVLAPHETGDQLAEIVVAQGDVRHSESRHDLDAGTFEIPALEHDDVTEPNEPTLAKCLNLFVGSCCERGDSEAAPLIEPLMETSGVLGEHRRVELVATDDQHTVVG